MTRHRERTPLRARYLNPPAGAVNKSNTAPLSHCSSLCGLTGLTPGSENASLYPQRHYLNQRHYFGSRRLEASNECFEFRKRVLDGRFVRLRQNPLGFQRSGVHLLHR